MYVLLIKKMSVCVCVCVGGLVGGIFIFGSQLLMKKKIKK